MAYHVSITTNSFRRGELSFDSIIIAEQGRHKHAEISYYFDTQAHLNVVQLAEGRPLPSSSSLIRIQDATQAALDDAAERIVCSIADNPHNWSDVNFITLVLNYCGVNDRCVECEIHAYIDLHDVNDTVIAKIKRKVHYALTYGLFRCSIPSDSAEISTHHPSSAFISRTVCPRIHSYLAASLLPHQI